MFKNSRESSLYLICLGLSVLILFLEKQKVLDTPKGILQKIVIPVQTGLHNFSGLGLNLFSGKLAQKDSEINRLTQENALLLAQTVQNKSLEEENQHMRRLLDAGLPVSWKVETAKVVSLTGDTLSVVGNYKPQIGEIVLVSEGQAGVYVGRVEEVFGEVVKIVLPTDTRSKLSVSVRHAQSLERRATGILEGRGGAVFLTQVLTQDTISEGDLVVLSDRELLVGKIKKVIQNNDPAWKQAEVQFIPDASNLDYVFYLKE